MGSRVTLKTIADAVGVSRTTVSNAYNRPDQLAPELRDRILVTARELGYAGPDPAARRLRSGRRDAVGLLLAGGPLVRVRRPGGRPAAAGDRPRGRGRGARRCWSSPSAGRRAGRRGRRVLPATRWPRTIPTWRRRATAGCRSSWSTSRASTATRSSASRTASARGWPPSTCSSSATGASRCSPSARCTTWSGSAATATRSRRPASTGRASRATSSSPTCPRTGWRAPARRSPPIRAPRP